SINKVPQFDQNNIPTYTYEVRNGFLVTVDDITQVAKFITAFEKAGVNSVNNILFYSSKEEDSQNKAMILAYKDAYSKALKLAKEAGFKSVSPKELNYDYFPVRRNAPYSMDAVAMKGSMEIYTPQSLDFIVNVRAVFNMEK
ncbi:MAG: SIMPL domain-containing protein, partial [Fusobacteriaceae bacterium]